MTVASPHQIALDFSVPELSPSPAAALEAAFEKIHRQMRPRTPVPEVRTEFFASSGANHSAILDGQVLSVRVSDLFVDAPPEVFETLAVILLSKLYRRKIDPRHNRRYRAYTMSAPMRERALRTRAQRGRPSATTGPAGRAHDLKPLFDDINDNYFAGSLPRPGLSWTLRKTRRLMGRYDFEQDVIFISRSLDSPSVPEYVVRYILFHEMLHVKHGTRFENDREVVHPPEFRREERRYEYYDAATAWLDSH